MLNNSIKLINTSMLYACYQFPYNNHSNCNIELEHSFYIISNKIYAKIIIITIIIHFIYLEIKFILLNQTITCSKWKTKY